MPELLRRAATTEARWARAFGPELLAAARVIAARTRAPDWRSYLLTTGFARDAVRAAAAAWVAGRPDRLAKACADETGADPRSLRAAAGLLCGWLGLDAPRRDWVTERRVTKPSQRRTRRRPPD